MILFKPLIEYPQSQQRRILGWWLAAIALLCLVALSLFFADYWSSLLFAWGILIAIFPLPVVLWIALLETFTVKIAVIFEHPYINRAQEGKGSNGLSLVNGRAIAQSYQTLDRLAREQSFAPLSSFGMERVQAREPKYFDAQEGARSVVLLIRQVEKAELKNKRAVLEELSRFSQVLAETAEKGGRFRFGVTVR